MMPAAHRIDGPITAATPAELAAFLKRAGRAAVQITVNSPGGNAMAGTACYQQLRSYRGAVTVVVEGVAASAASLIAMAGRPIQMHAGSFLMIHEAHSVSEGPAREMREHAAILERVSAVYLKAYAERSGKPEREIADMMANETWMTAEEAVQAGFADAILEPLRAAASINLNAFEYRNTPAALCAAGGQEIVMDTQMQNEQLIEAATRQEITAVARQAGLGLAWIDEQAGQAVSIGDARAAALDAIAARSAAAVRPSSVVIVRDEGDTLQAATTDYVASRILGRAPNGPAASLRGHTLADVAAMVLEGRGQRIGRGVSAEQIFAKLTTSDLPNLLTSGASRAMAELYPTVRTQLVELAQVRNMPDFRPTTLIRLAQHTPLDEVAEHGEVPFAYPMENGEQIKLATYANRFAVTRQALVNDDLNGLQEWMAANAQGAAARERLLVSGLLTAGSGVGPTLSDGNPWFHSSRGNIATAAAPSVTSLAQAVSLMRSLKDGKGNTVFALEPYAIVVSPALEFVARQLVASISTTTTRDEIQPYSLSVIVEPALTGNRWWLAPRPATRRCITMGYLGGMQSPTVETFEAQEILGVTLRVHFDVAAAVQDPIGWVTNAGA
ncbi:head maturation protease, ClpP-related [Falsiroseomonas tokyonensis]|uniref:Head maturation protease, ClpP-related n=1 Tax=Falsiroseomonas tokyonensis TaxID=430521 RepID=A0ABV7BZ69_9PROT|nr:head maturation protease, ClpP-related [Falsiroseomonas tokyonensis]MBU8539492.1 Clp protease ClpP [Falsiroseomonas tokyonensis]